MSWYYYLDKQNPTFPFRPVHPLPSRLAAAQRRDCRSASYGAGRRLRRDMLVLIHWQGRKMAVPLSQLAAIHPDESTAEAIGDWHYWVAQGYLF